MSDLLRPSQRPQSFHPDFNREVRMVVLAVEGQGFKIDAARIAMHSKFLDDMLGDQEGYLGSSHEGTIDNPIVIPGCTAQAFTNFLGWLNHESWAPLVADHSQQLLDILHICHMWEILPGVKFTSQQLLKFDLRAARLLHLACQYQITDWIPEVVQKLISLPLADYTDEDLALIGLKTYSIIATTKEALSLEQRRLGNHAPLPKTMDDGPFCNQPDICKKLWCEKWFYVVVRCIHHITDPLPLSLIPETLETTDHRGMHSNCKAWLIDWLKHSDSIFREEFIIQDTITSVEKLLPA